MSLPVPESTPLSAQEQQWVESVVTRQRTNPFLVAGGLLAAFGVYRKVVQSWMESEPNKTYAANNLPQVMYGYWSRFAPSWRSMTEAYILSAVRAGITESGIKLPEVMIHAYVNEYTRSLGEYIHQTTVDAVIKGYNALTNRRLPNLSAYNFITSAIGVSPRVMNSLVNIWTSEDSKAYTDIKQPSQRTARAKRVIDAGIKQRGETIGGHEEWNAKEQVKEMAWQYAVLHGILPVTARRRWVTADDEKVCVYCGGLDGAEVRVKEQFETDAGAFWTPPLHPNCRCTVKLISSFRKLLKPRKEIEKSDYWKRQKRDEDGQWVKGAGGHRMAVAPEAPKPPPPTQTQEQKPRETAPSAGPPRLKFDAAPPKLSFDEAAPPALRFERKQEAPPKLRFEAAPPKLKFEQETPPVPKLTFEAAPPKLEFKAPAKVQPKVHVEEEAVPEVTFDTEDVAQPLKLRAFEPERYVTDIHYMEENGRPKAAYGIVPWEVDELDEMKTFRPRGLRMVHDFDELHEMVESEISSQLDSYISELFDEYGGESVPVFTDSGQQALASYDAIYEAFEWLRAKDQRMHSVNYGTPWSGPSYDSDQFITVEIGGEDRTIRASRIVSELGLEEVLEMCKPTIVTTTRYDASKSDVDYGTHRNQSLEYNVSGPHQVMGVTDHVISEEGEVIPANVYEIDPYDYEPDDSDYYD